MKAFLLAAGLGTRLRPLTDRTPKCLVPVAGRPLLSYWMALLARHGFTDVVVNVHHLAGQVRAFVAGLECPVRVTLFEEPTLLGSAGTVRANSDWVADGRPFLVAYADTLTNVDLGALMTVHELRRPLLTMALFHADEPSRCGIAELDETGAIVGFEEKPASPKSDLANAGLYVSDRRVIERIPAGVPVDFGLDVLPRLVGEMYGVVVDGSIIDVGTPQSYARAQGEAGRLGLPDLEVGSQGGRR